jgi:hypothetical protein
LKRHVSFFDAMSAAAAAVLMSFVIWQDFDPRLVVFFILALAAAELFIVFRWRLSIACMHCGFDPVLYKKKPELAAQRVRMHLERRRQDPLFAFAPTPKLPVIIKKVETSGPASKASRRSSLPTQPNP